MTVKDVRGRRRYVAYSLSRTVPKSELESKLPSGFRVIQSAASMCIVRCAPGEEEKLAAAMSEIDSCHSLRESGNLITLRRRYPILQETRSRYIAFQCDPDIGAIEYAKTLVAITDPESASVKFCKSGYLIIKCTLRSVSEAKSAIENTDPKAHSFLSSYRANDLRRKIAERSPELKGILFSRAY